MHPKITNIPTFLNFDDEESVIPPEDAKDILNLRRIVSSEGKEGISTNILGTTQVPFNLGTSQLGTPIPHRALGWVEDKVNGGGIYFLWSATGQHKVMRYHKKNQTIEQLVQYDFGWTQRTRISGDLVQDNSSEYITWTDTRPKGFDITRMSVLNKKRCWDLYTPKTSVFALGNTTVVITALDINGLPVVPQPGQVIQFEFTVPQQVSNEQGFEYIASVINTPGSVFEAKACGCSLELCTVYESVQRVSFQFTLNINGQSFPTWVVPSNWYGVDLIDQMFEAGMYPSPYNPLPEYKEDSDITYNYVKDIPWQVRLAIYYKNNQRAVYSPFSQVPINNIRCNTGIYEKSNYIDVSFNNQDLLDPKVLTMVKEVGIIVREGNDGVQKEVERIGLCDFLDTFVSTPIAHYRFYNDIIPKGLSTEDTTQNFDYVPRENKAQRLFNNRMVYGGITKDAPLPNPECVDLKCTPVISDDPNPQVHKVTVRIRIYNSFLRNYGGDVPGVIESIRNVRPPEEQLRGGIFHDISRIDPETNKPSDRDIFYGGGTMLTGTFGIRSGMEDRYQQLAPEGGWCVYAAGTDYRALSKQIKTGLQTDPAGAISWASSNQELVKQYFQNDGDVYSEAELYLPNGTWTIRLPSSWCSVGDKLQKGRMYDLDNGREWHKTSTPVWGVQPNGGQWSVEKEITVVVNGVDTFAGEFVIADFAYRFDDTDQTAFYIGYLMDAFGESDASAIKKSGIAVEKAYVMLGDNNTGLSTNRACFTDHNGFFYFFKTTDPFGTMYAVSVNNPAASAPLLIAMREPPNTFVNSPEVGVLWGCPTSLQDLYDDNMRQADFTSGTDLTLRQVVFSTNSPDARNKCSTIVTGTVLDQNFKPIPNLTVVYEGGRTGVTDENGFFRIIAWGDMMGASNEPENNNNRLFDQIIVIAPAQCNPTYPNGQTANVLLTEFGENPAVSVNVPPYSPTAIYEIQGGVFFPVSMGAAIFKSRKRGGSYVPSIVEYDKMLRQCAVNRGQEVYIPFLTEDLSKYDTNLPPNTYKRGLATLNFNLNSQPTEEAFYYQIVLPKEKFHQRWLNWVVNDVKYIVSYDDTAEDFVETTYANGDANMILLDISNLIQYARDYLNTQVSYDWQQNDRLRLLARRDKTYFEGMFDYEVVAFKSPAYLVIRNVRTLEELQSGLYVQLYTPRPFTEEEDEFFFEQGDIFPIVNPGTVNRAYSVTSGTLTSGDTYWRNRSIPVTDDEDNFLRLYEYIMETNSLSDFFVSTVTDIGRIQVASDIGELNRPALLRNSGRFVPNTLINDLNRFRAGEEKELNASDGLIIDIKTPGIQLHITQKTGMVSNYIERVEWQDSRGQAQLSSADRYFGTGNRLQGEWGAQFMGGVAQFVDYVYGVDTDKGVAWRRSDNGIFPISYNKANSYFSKYAQREIWDITSASHANYREWVITIWEKRTLSMQVFTLTGLTLSVSGVGDISDMTVGDEVDLTYFDRVTNADKTITANVFQINNTDPSNIIFTVLFSNNGQLQTGDAVTAKIRGDADTIAFFEGNEGQKRWTTRFSYKPELYGEMDDGIVMFQNGQLWLNETNPVRNNFFGVQYPSKVTPVVSGVSNGSQDVKMWFALWLDAYQSNRGCNWQAVSITNKLGQLSRIKVFQKKEQYWHSEFKKDLNTTVNNPILNGKTLRSSELVIELQNDFTGLVELRTVNALYEVSYRNTQ